MVIPDLLYYIPNLEHLEIIGYFEKPLVNFEKSFGRLPNLKYLHLSDIIFEKPPEYIINLKKLERLRIDHSNLLRLPLIDNLELLKSLYLSGNKKLIISKNRIEKFRKKLSFFSYFN